MVKSTNKKGSNSFTVRGGITTEESEYGKGVRYYDTVSEIARAWKEANPGDKRSNTQIQLEIARLNGLKDRKGKDCEEKNIRDVIIRMQQVLVLPEGNPVNPKLHFECPPPRKVQPPERLEIIEAPEPVQPPPPAVVQELPPSEARAKQPAYPSASNLAKGNRAEIQDAFNFPLLFTTMVPDQPAVAARGLSYYGNNVQTGKSLAKGIVEHALTFAPIPVGAIGGVQVALMAIGGMTSITTPGGTSMNAREGSEGALNNQNVAGDNGRIDIWPFTGRANPFAPSHATQQDATRLPGFGIQLDQNGRIVDTKNPRNDNNQLYYITSVGDYAPAITTSEVAARTNFIQRNETFLQAEPSDPIKMPGLNNYSMAALANTYNLEPQIAALLGDVSKNDPAGSKDKFQKVIGIMNYQETLVGISNYDVRVDVSKVTGEQAGRLNPRERIRWNRNEVIKAAQQQFGITGLDVNYLPEASPVQSISKEQLREKLITYYDTLAKEKPGVFDYIYSVQFDTTASDGSKQRPPEYSLKTDEDRRKAATTFVDALEVVKTMPDKGFSFEYLDHHISTRKTGFNPIETFEYTAAGAAKGQESVDAALKAAFANTDNVKLVMERANYAPIGQVIAQRDNLSVQLPVEVGETREVRWDRTVPMEEVKKLGYREGLIDQSFTTRHTSGVLRDLPAMQQDIIASAAKPEIVALRQKHLMNLAGHGNDGPMLRAGGLGVQMLYALATEPGNTTLLQMEDNIRKSGSTAADAERQIETLRQGVIWAKEKISATMVGATHTEIATYVEAQEMASAGNHTVTPTVTRVAAKDRAWLNDATSTSPKARGLLNEAATRLPDADRVTVARAALGDTTVVSQLANSNLDVAAKDRFAAIAANPAALSSVDAGFVLSSLAATTQGAQNAARAIAANAAASAALTTGLASQLTQQPTVEPRKNTQPPRNLKDTALDRTHAATGIANERERDVALVKTFFEENATSGTALRSLQQTNPQYTAALVIASMRDPNVRAGIVDKLNDAGDEATPGVFSFLKRWTNTHAAGNLGRIVTDLSTAMETNNQTLYNTANGQLQAFITASEEKGADGKPTEAAQFNALAFQQLFESAIAAPGGRAALTATVVSAIDAASNPQAERPLWTSTHNANETIGTFYTAAIKDADVADAKRNMDQQTRVWQRTPVGGGIQIPFILIPYKKKDKPPPQEPPPPAPVVPPPAPVVPPPAPVVPPPAPVVPPPAPVVPPPAPVVPPPAPVFTPTPTPFCAPTPRGQPPVPCKTSMLEGVNLDSLDGLRVASADPATEVKPKDGLPKMPPAPDKGPKLG